MGEGRSEGGSPDLSIPSTNELSSLDVECLSAIEFGPSTKQLTLSVIELRLLVRGKSPSIMELVTSITDLGTSCTDMGTSFIDLGTSVAEVGTSVTQVGTSVMEIGTSVAKVRLLNGPRRYSFISSLLWPDGNNQVRDGNWLFPQ
jgi:hypothetical protein